MGQAGDTREHSVWALCRTSAADPNVVYHVATFDTGEGDHYNRMMCEIVQRSF